MFETVVPEKFGKRSRKALYEALPLSIAFHALIGVAAIVANVWDVAFPDQSPAQSLAFNLAETPPPPPPPPPPPKPLARQAPVVQVVQAPDEIVAPTMIPDVIPELRPETVIASLPDASAEGVEGGVEAGILGGWIGGMTGGQVGGLIGGTEGGVVVENDRVMIERDKPLPMFPLSQVYPTYPEEARLRAWEDQMVVRYVIGKNGRVKEVSVIWPPERPIFVDVTLRAIKNWRFRPLVRDGERQEVVHELTIYYRLEQVS